MNYKRYRSIALALLITTNIAAIEKVEFVSPQNIIIFSALTITSIMLLLKVKNIIARCYRTYFYNHNTSSSNINIIDNQLIFNPQGNYISDTTQLPLIKPSGTMKELDLTPIEQVQIFNEIATIHIDDTQRPRIEIDEAFKNNLIFTVTNGILKVTTPDSKPRKFAYNNQPLCTVYAKLLTTNLIASVNSSIHLTKQKLNNITAVGSSTIQGTIQQIQNLNLCAQGSSELKLNGIDCKNIASDASGSATITLSGKTINQHIKAEGSSNYEGSHLVTQNGFIQAQALGSSNITVAGIAANQNISLAGSSNYYGLALCAESTTIDALGSSDATLYVTKNLKAKMLGSCSIAYKGNPTITKTSLGSSSFKQITYQGA